MYKEELCQWKISTKKTLSMAHGLATAMALFVAARINSPTLNDTMGESIVFTFGFFFIFIVFNVFTTKLMKRLHT